MNQSGWFVAEGGVADGKAVVCRPRAEFDCLETMAPELGEEDDDFRFG